MKKRLFLLLAIFVALAFMANSAVLAGDCCKDNSKSCCSSKSATKDSTDKNSTDSSQCSATCQQPCDKTNCTEEQKAKCCPDGKPADGKDCCKAAQPGDKP